MLRNNPIQRTVLFCFVFNFRYREIMTSRENGDYFHQLKRKIVQQS